MTQTMLAEVHGWRTYTAGFCSRTGELVLVEPSGRHLHDRQSTRALCQKDNIHPDWDIPSADCSCGFQGWFDVPSSIDQIVGHVIALGYTMIHEHGWRTAKYTLESIIDPTFDEISVIGDAKADVKVLIRDIAGRLKIRIQEEPNCDHCKLITEDHSDLGREIIKLISIPESLSKLQ